VTRPLERRGPREQRLLTDSDEDCPSRSVDGERAAVDLRRTDLLLQRYRESVGVNVTQRTSDVEVSVLV